MTGRISRTREKLIIALKKFGVRLSEEGIVDAIGDVEATMEKRGVEFAVAFWEWWERIMQVVSPIEPKQCKRPGCANSFLDWDRRERQYCCRDCKKSAQHARWYSLNAPERIKQVIAWRRFSRSTGNTASDD